MTLIIIINDFAFLDLRIVYIKKLYDYMNTHTHISMNIHVHIIYHIILFHDINQN